MHVHVRILLSKRGSEYLKRSSHYYQRAFPLFLLKAKECSLRKLGHSASRVRYSVLYFRFTTISYFREFLFRMVFNKGK